MRISKRFVYTILISSLLCISAAFAGTDTPPKDILRGTVRSIDQRSLNLATASGLVTIRIGPSLIVYASHPSTLSQVKDSSFVGVSSVREPDGSQRATEIHIFPDALRGLGEGSYLMNTAPGATRVSRMTNGRVAALRTPTASRMTNGVVSSSGTGRQITVDFNGGEQSISIPPDVPVTEIAKVNTPIAPGDTVVVRTKTAPDGALVTDTIMLRNPPASPAR